ncbi:hypothetical protein G7Z17_g7731 [Cylindrodendrum hubeiense]|uniref:Uncharacterized protein n=1 Tax=Cylindrodendrum hubeiense TaxID=595255 RepID=A0A9P5H6K1_9HYPO|nr:hypothetical protein G7Z17_g7731 [Cylindrodendrum hubeiense]
MLNHVPDFEPALIAVDEVGRLSETSALVSVSKCPYTPHLCIGDARQFSPINLVCDNRDVKDFFRPQRGISLLKRIEAVGAMTATLRVNNRAHLDVVGRHVTKYLAYGFDVAEAKEMRVGTSFATPINARFGRELIAMMHREGPLRNAVDFVRNVDPVRFGSTLVIVGCSAQKNKWQGVTSGKE